MIDIDKDLELATAGDKDAIERVVIHYKPLVARIARKYFLVGAGSDDLMQEGMIGLYKAVMSFKPDGGAQFKTYATLCVKRQIVTAIRVANNNKNLPLNAYFSINNQGMIVVSVVGGGDEDDEEKGIYIPADIQSPEEQMISKENIEEIHAKINELLSDFERQVIGLYIEGLNYVEIAKLLKKEAKAIDNALSRIKIKLK
jgi:RNA polymerase sporulation-specific sigma factor